jgi:hypothetical protein
MESPDPKPRLRPRISLLSLLMLTALAACAIVIVMQLWEIGPLRSEVRRLRDELGYLHVPYNERHKVHAIALVSEKPREWRYRISVPESPKYQLRIRSGAMPARPPGLTDSEYYKTIKQGVSDSKSSLQPGQSLLLISLQRDEQGNWLLRNSQSRISENGSSRGGGVTGLNFGDLDDFRFWGNTRSSIGNTLTTFEAGELVNVLSISPGILEEGFGVPPWSISDDSGQPHPGVEAWLEPLP